MTRPRIALVGAPGDRGTDLGRRALEALLPEAAILIQPVGSSPTPDLDGLWLLPAEPGRPADTHDASIAGALDLGLPLLGPVATDEGGTPFVTAVPGGRMAALLGTEPVQLAPTAAGGRPAHDYLTAPGTIWFADAHRNGQPAAITTASPQPLTLTDHELATEAGVHPLLIAFAEAARARAARRQVGPASPYTAGHPVGRSSLAPLPDDEPRSYVHQMRTGGYRWWRPLLALAAGTGTFVAIAVVLSLLLFIMDPSSLQASPEDFDPTAPATMLIGNLILAGLIPATLVATRVGHWRPMGKVWSVAGRIRWRWLLQAGLVTLAVWGAYLAISWVVSGEEPTTRPEHWQWLLVITLLTTPLQAAGEEVAFRGGLMQGVGAWIRNPVTGLVVATVLSAALFALAHTSLDPWILFDLGAMAIASCYLTWRTGGLEAAIVLHVVNNLVITIGLTLLGGLESAYVTEETTSTAGSSGLSALATLVMTAILLWLARRTGVAQKGVGSPALG